MFRWPGRPGEGPHACQFELAAGREIECATWGPAPTEAPTFVILHEGLGCVALWRKFPAELSRRTGCGVLAYSRTGYGKSSPVDLPRPITHMADEARDVLPRLIEAIEPETLFIIGHSDGGTVAAHYLAGETHAALKSAVLMAPHFFFEASNAATICETRDTFENGNLRARLAKYHGDNVDCAFYGWADTWLDPAFEQWDIRTEISRWRHPVLYIQGRDDPYGSEAQGDAVRLGAKSPVEFLWLDDCGHSPHLEKSEATLSAIVGFAIGDVSGKPE